MLDNEASVSVGHYENFPVASLLLPRRKRRAVVMAFLTLMGWSLIFLLAVYVARLLAIPVHASFIVLIMPIVTLVELIPARKGENTVRETFLWNLEN